MTIGEGKYSEECQAARIWASALGAVLIIVEGKHGNGFEMQVPLEYAEDLPRVLREIADTVEAEVSALKREKETTRRTR